MGAATGRCLRDGALRDLAQRLYSTQTFQRNIDEGQTSQYRHWFRLNLPHEVQQDLTSACGDRVVPAGDYAGIDHAIDYPCSTGLSAESIAGAIAILRNDPDAIRLLRLRYADVESSLFNLTISNSDMRAGLRAIAKS